MQFGFHALHRKVGALHNSNLQRAAARGVASNGPLAQRRARSVRIGKVRLEHDTGVEANELRLVQHTGERGDRQWQVAVLLHVEVDERARRGRCRVAVQRSQAFANAVHGMIEGEHVEVGHHGGDLQRHIVHIGSHDALTNHRHPLGRLRVAQDRFAQDVDVQPKPVGSAGGCMTRECGVVCGQHHPAAFPHDPRPDQRHHQPRKNRRNQSADAQHHPIDDAKRRRHTDVGDYRTKACGSAPR